MNKRFIILIVAILVILLLNIGVYVLFFWERDLVPPTLENVSWVSINNGVIKSNLSENLPPESPAQEGWALYPDKESPDDNVDRKTVAIRAKVEPPRSGIPIYFRVFDVDDPSDDERIDANGEFGGDNDLATKTGAPGNISSTKGVTILDGSGDDGFGTATPIARAVTNKDGEAEIWWAASNQPGDNFCAAAAMGLTDDNAIAFFDAISTRGLGLSPPPSVSLDQYQITPLLTVHRRLWIAIDKMAPPPKYELVTGRLVFGPEQGMVSAIDRHTTETHIYYLADDDKATSWTRSPGMYQDSIYLMHERSCFLQPDPSHNTYFMILGVEQRDGRPWVAVRTDWRLINTREGWYLQALPEPIALHDRATTGMPYLIVTEDSDTAPDFPTIDHARRVFARCYVVADVDPRLGGRTLPWIRNAANEEIIAYGRDIRFADPLYWQCYLLGAYEYTVLEDGDPDWHAMRFYTPITEGVTVREIPEDYRYTAILYEMAHENWPAVFNTKKFLDEKIVAHELVHQFDIMHTSGIMEEFAEYREPWLHAPDVAIIRATRVP